MQLQQLIIMTSQMKRCWQITSQVGDHTEFIDDGDDDDEM